MIFSSGFGRYRYGGSHSWTRSLGVVRAPVSLGIDAEKDYAVRVDYFTNGARYYVRCRGCKRDIAILVERGLDEEKQPKVFSLTFHTFSECLHCHERHFYDYSDMHTRYEPEPALP
jgi:hypothetical protein